MRRDIYMFDLSPRMLSSQVPPQDIPARALRQLLDLFSSRALRTAQVGSSAITEDREPSVTEARSKNRRTERAFIISHLTRHSRLSSTEVDIPKDRNIDCREEPRLKIYPYS